MKYLFSALLIFSLSITNAQDDQKVLADLVDEFLSKVDSKEMHDRFWAEDLIYTGSAGTRHGKATIMGGFDAENESSEPGPTYTAEDLKVKMLGKEVAVVTFKLVSMTSDGTLTQYLNSGIFQKREGQWKVVNWQATKMP